MSDRRPFHSALSASREIPLWYVVAVVAAYVLPGLVGHDPWKPDEAYVFGGVLDMLKHGDWVVVKVGGVPFLEKPPLYHWIASITAILFKPLLPLHDGARLASGIFVGAAAGAVAWASRLLWGPGHGRIGSLMTLSAAGLLVNAQMMLPDLPLMTGFAFALAGFAGCSRNRPWGGAVLGIGVGVGFLGKGIIAPAVLGLSALALPVLFTSWRSRRYALQLGIAAAAAAPFLLVWPAALWLRSPALFMTWFWENNVGRYVGFSVAHLGAAAKNGYWLSTWPWFLFPPWLIVAAALVRDRLRVMRHPAWQIGLVVSGCLASVLITSASARAIYALPMVPALALAASGSVGEPTTRGFAWLYPLGVAVGLVSAVVTWWAWGSLVITSNAPDWPWITRSFPAFFSMDVDYDDVGIAAILTIGFAWTCVSFRNAIHRGLLVWVGSLALCWGLVALLWFPWIDHAKSYRGMFESLSQALPSGIDCVASMGLGESERAMLEYVLGFATIDPNTSCTAVLRQRRADQIATPIPSSWRLAWTGSRPGDFRERFELWLRNAPTARQ